MASAAIGTTSILTPRADFAISTRRRLKNHLWWVLCGLGLALLVIPVVWILVGVIGKGVSVFHWSELTTTTQGIGLSNTIVGTLVIMVGVAIVAGLVGMSGGIYLAEFASPNAFSTILRSASEVLSGIPSIVFGYCGYLALVVGLHWGYCLLPAVIVVSMLVVPYVMKATELSLNQVPLAYREGAEGLGMSKVYLLRRVILRAALPGILTGIIIALAISVGETAPLLYTAGFTNAYPSFALIHNHPVGYLTYAVYSFIEVPQQSIVNLAYVAALLLVVLVMILILASRVIVRVSQKYAPNRAMGRPSRGERRAAREHAAGMVTASLAEGHSRQ